MAQFPPDPNHPQYVPYMRPSISTYGSPEQLRALHNGFNGLSIVFLLNIAALYGIAALVGAFTAPLQNSSGAVLKGYAVGYLALASLMAYASYF